MGGRGKRGKPTTNTRAGAGRGGPPTAQFNPAPTPAQSAWGRPAPTPAPAPTQSAWGAPAPAPVLAQSAWGRPAPASAAPTQSAWGPAAASNSQSSSQGPAGSAKPNSAWGSTSSAPTPVNGQSSSRPPVESGRPRDQPQQPRQERPEPRTYVGYNGTAARKTDRGSVRDRKVLYQDLVVTKPEGVTKQGKSGQTVLLTTNFFRLIKKPQWNLYQYRVDFSPLIENDLFMKKLIREQAPNLGGLGYVFDGTVLFLCVKLRNDVTEFMTKDRDESPIQITVKFVKLLSMLNAESVQILNLILRKNMHDLDLQLVGRNYYDALAKINIPEHRLQLWPGYDTSIRQHEQDILMCAQITNKVMRTDTVYDILRKYFNRNATWKTDFSTAVLGMTVLTDYNNRTYRIDDITFDLSPMDTFPTKDGEISFVNYYERKHGIRIRDQQQPMLISRVKDRDLRAGKPEHILLIPELCRATGFTDEMRSNRRLMEDVAKYTRLGPAERIARLMAFNKRLQTTPKCVENFTKWNFKLDTQMVQVNGRQLPIEPVLFANNKQAAQHDWSQCFRNNSMYTQQPLINWVVITPKNKSKEAHDFVGILQKAAIGMRYEIANPLWIETANDYGGTYAKEIDNALNTDPQLVMCVLMGQNVEKYSIIKKKCYVERGVPCQVMVSKTITPRPGKQLGSLMSVGTKVAIQINAKLGGAPWMVNIPQNGIMVVGFDVCHDTNDKSKSYGALVATMDMKKSANYFSAVSQHENGEELCNTFALNMAKAIRCYGATHNELPARIFIYRDGVGEGQTDYVREHEIKAIRNQLDNIYKGGDYKLLFVVVSKRINTRFFRGTENPLPGTIVDDVITLPERHDFNMVSPLVTQGTVSPTNYNILFNTSRLSSDNIQKFTYKMTYLYYNWSATLAVPAVCQYAHKLAFLVGNFIHQSPSPTLEKRLYFL